MKVKDCIVSHNIDINVFASAIPGGIVIGQVHRVADDFEYERFFLLPKLHFLKFATCIEKLATCMARKIRKKEDEAEEYELDTEKKVVRKNSVLFFVEDDFVRWQYDISKAEVLQIFCRAIFSVAFSVVLPNNGEYDILCRLNVYLRTTTRSIEVSTKHFEDFLRELPSARAHYLRANFDLVQFSFKLSALGDVK